MEELLFSSKAITLKLLKKNIKKSKIQKLYYFNVNDWMDNPKSILQKIQTKFSNSYIIVRSSALDEDSLTSSRAGYYDSVLNVNSKSKQAISSAINHVINSYKKSNNSNQENQILVQEQAKVLVQEQAQAAQEKATQYREGMTSEEDILKSLINQKIARITGGILKRSSLIEDILNDLKRDANNPEIDHQEHDLFIIEAANSRIIHEIKEIDSEINHICPKIKVNSTEKDNIINIVWTSLKRGDVQQSMSYIVWAGLRIEVRNRLEKDKFSLKKINLKNKNQDDNAKKIIEDIIKEMKIEIIKDYGFLIGL